ncbi:MAG: helix-turn-helix transcriptional regulator [Bacilli bacterium]|nr:helix-turn-helix transcriptional regulator [Bacilli bacterium]
MTTKQLIGQNLKYIRYKTGLSQEEFYTSHNLSVKYLASVERGEVNVTVDFLDRLAKKLKVNVSEFFVQDKKRIIKQKRIDSKIALNQ